MQEILANAVTVIDGKPVTTSLKIAEVFGKQHKDVLKSVRELEIPDDYRQRNFAQTVYERPNPSGGKPIPTPMHLITRDGFTLLAMGFTGKKAMQFKIAYIEAFNAMEQELRSVRNLPVRRRRATGKRVKFADAVDMLNRVSFRIQRLAAVVCPGSPFSVPSSPDEVADFCRFARLTNVNPVKFFNYYESRRWRINGVLIADWQSVCRSWQFNDMGWRAIECDHNVAGGR